MKRIYSILFVWMIVLSAWAQSGEGYDPENPADPTVCYILTMEATPRSGGSVDRSRVTAEAGQTVSCHATAKVGYAFKQWMIGDSLVSTESSFSYTMPAHDVVLIAYFEYEGYNPENPDDPFADGYEHNVTLYATPSVGGYFNSASFMLTENEETNIYAYPRNGYRFVSWKQNGKIISTGNPLKIKMGTKDLEYTATFVYDPVSPDEPGANNFNAATGELTIDKFIPGNLNSTISATVGGSENYPLVQSIVIVGRMNSSDFGFSHKFSNCSLIDLSRTTGYTEIPSWGFEGMSSLTKLLLPSTVERIGNGAFNGCSNLSELICYAAVPPALDPNAFGSSAGLVVRVPLSAMSLYQAADGWKELAISPLDEDTYQLNVSLPADAADGRYKNMTLELNNISSGQTLRYIITDRTTYAFANLISGTKYNVLVKNASNAVLGSIFDVMIEDEDVNVAFESLLQPQNIIAKVVTPDNTDVTSLVIVRWFDEEGKYLSQGAELPGAIEGAIISCQVTLSKELAMQYIAPQDMRYTIKSSDNNIVMSLLPFEEVTLSGKVKDATTERGIYNATITISQTLNGKHSKSIVAKTDTAGVFSATVYNAACDVVVAAYDYISQTIQLDEWSNAEELSNILLESITGVRIKTIFTYTSSVPEGESSEVQDGYGDYANVSYTIYNKTAQRAINDFNVQSPYIVLLEEVNESDVLSITAKSRTNAFKDVTADGVVDANNRVEVTFPIVEWGKLQASYNQSASNRVVGILYNAKGELQDKFSYSDSKLTIEGLQDGTYTLVTMEGSDFFNSILNLSEFSNAGLVEGTHYVKHNVTIQSGKVTALSIDNVPKFDESQLYYTGTNTQFTVNKQSVTVGNYITLRAQVDFKSKYTDKVSDVKLVVDLPESCEFVDNSVMVGAGTSSYSVGKNRVTVELANTDDVVRFCVIPNEGGYCSPNAFVQFTFEGKEVLQPIGIAEFEAESMKISVPEITSLTSVVVNGVATADSEVRIYDNGVLVGTTYSLANGQWASKVELYKPYSKSYHSFYAEITTPDGQKFTTANKLLDFDKNYVSLSKVTMIYKGTVIEFDPVERKNSTNTYSYVPGNDEFTFTAEFANTDTSSVKNVEFVVLASDGTTRTLEPEYNSVKKLWVAKSKYGNSDKLPVNVKIEYEQNTSSYQNYSTQRTEDENRYIVETICKYSPLELCDNVKVIKDAEEECEVLLSRDADHTIIGIKQLSPERILELRDSAMMIEHNGKESFIKFDSEQQTICIWNDSAGIEATIMNHSSVTRGFLDYMANLGESALRLYHRIPLIGNNDLVNSCDEVNHWNTQYLHLRQINMQRRNELKEMILAKCTNGNYKLSSFARDWFQSDYILFADYCDLFEETLLKKIQEYEANIRRRCGVIAALSTIETVAGLGKIGTTSVKLGVEFFKEFKIPWFVQVGETLGSSYLIDESTRPITHWMSENIANYFANTELELMAKYNAIENQIKSRYQECPEEDEDDKNKNDENEGKDKNKNKDEKKDKGDDFPNPPLTPSIDPAGYVYEGVSSNRIEGVTATCYYKETVEDMYGDLRENVVLWDAEEYAQENPLFTDEDGMYQWFVPQGLWQVKFEKEGYETTYSEWLPVPPPQLEVNIAMVQNKQPDVKTVHAYEDGIVVEFDKYMQPATLNTDNIFVVQNGEKVAGTVTMLNEEIAYRDSSVVYVSKVRFVYEQPITAEEVTLTVSNRVKSYAGLQMQDTYTQTFDIEKEIKAIVADSLVTMYYGGEYVLTVKAQPAEAAAGKTLTVNSLSPMILTVATESIVLDDNGEAVVKVYGELPGTAAVNYSIVGYDYTASTIVKVDYEDVDVTANPTASIASGTTVEKGTEVTLYCATEGAVIYYTLDGSCPCDESALQYDGTPIVINEDTELRIMAVAEGRSESYVVTYYYYIAKEEEPTLIEVNIYKKWDDVLICDNSAYELVAYQWYKDDMPIDGETNQYYSEEGGLNGSYYVMAKDTDGNWGKSNTIICQKRNNSKLKVTPTVVKKNEKCMVSINRSATNGEVVYLNVFNAMGQMIREIRMYDHSIELEFDNSGPYFIKAVELNGNMESEKIIVIE